VSKADDIFFKQFGLILGLLVLFTISVYFIAAHIGNFEFRTLMNRPAAIAERIRPVARVRVEGDKVAAAAATASPPAATAPAVTASAAAAGGDKSGEQAYASGCIACHATGAAGAPKVGDHEAWSARAAAGIAALLKSATNGKGAMPPKGGTSLNAKELEAAIHFMLSKSGVKL